MTSPQMPKSAGLSGRPGPGETITWVKVARSTCSSLRTTVGATPVTAATW
jgi:hypothetical protein